MLRNFQGWKVSWKDHLAQCFSAMAVSTELLQGALKQERKELKPIPLPHLAMPGHQLFKASMHSTVGNP